MTRSRFAVFLGAEHRRRPQPTRIGLSKEEDIGGKMHKQQVAFEEFRNNTNIFQKMAEWRAETLQLYETKRLGPIMSLYQYQLCRYMAGEGFGDDVNIMPRGVLTYWKPGSGKTLGFIAAGLYVMRKKHREYANGAVVIITNKSLQQKTLHEVTRYLASLNGASIGMDLDPAGKAIDVSKALKSIHFVTYNDSRNLEKNLVQQFNALSGFENRFVVVDEAHNLFRAKGNEDPKASARGNVLYNLLMSYESLQLVLATGTPVVSDPMDLVYCFQMLTRNQGILDSTYFSEVFVSAQNTHINREILVRRIYGLVHLVESDDQGDKPQLEPTILHQLPMSDAIRSQYNAQRHREGIKDSFMQGSRQISNSVTVQKQGSAVIVSDKFARIMEFISNTPKHLHMVYSNFVQQGCVVFRDYCFQGEGWEEVLVDSRGLPFIQDANGNKKPYTERVSGIRRLVMVHGEMDAESRTRLVALFNARENSEGRFMNVIVLSPASMEGLDLKCVRHVHILEPQWSWAQTEQAIYRAVRRGSHAALPPAERTVQSHIYIAYSTLMVDPEPVNRLQQSLQAAGYSTDQIIYYKSKIKDHLSRQFLQSLQMASINCQDYQGRVAAHVYQQFQLDISEEQVCYKCNPTDQRLFDPVNIYKDFAVNNCQRSDVELPKASMHYMRLGHVQYGYSYDPYARFGVRFYETRDASRRPVPEDSDLFQALLGIFKARVIPVDSKPDEGVVKEEDAGQKGVKVRIFKQREVKEPQKSNNEFILRFIGPQSRLIRASYIFGTETGINEVLTKQTGMDLEDLFLTPTAALLLLHFKDSAEATLQQVQKTIQAMVKKGSQGGNHITSDLFMHAVAKIRGHSLSGMPNIRNDLDLISRQSFLLNTQQFTFRRAVLEIANLVVNQVQASKEYGDVVVALKSLIQDGQLIFVVPADSSPAGMYVLKHILKGLVSTEGFSPESQKQSHADEVLKTSFDNKTENLADKPSRRPQTSLSLALALINQLHKPRTLLWTQEAFSRDREDIKRVLVNTRVDFQRQDNTDYEYIIEPGLILRKGSGQIVDTSLWH